MSPRKNKLIVLLLLVLATTSLFAQDTLTTKAVQAILYTGSGGNQSLIVGLGGSEGGNAWASSHWRETREQFIKKGYAFLAIGYFDCAGTPKILDRIEISDIYKAIIVAKSNPKIDGKKIAIVGGSRGADLALLLGSYYPEISCVVGMSASHVTFPGHTQDFASACWTFAGKELPFVPVNEAAVPFLMKRDLRRAFEAMLTDTAASQKAMIKVERINGPILLLTGKSDEIIPASPMAEKMVGRLKERGFKHVYEHIAFDGKHVEPTKHFDLVFAFLAKHFKAEN